ncbi:zinc-dependent alcohol dehydrogenase family protein [Wenzhouxiangella limi]|uniref:enoyl-[acyl-carrier-protein] reductase n=1 Tax=Wenzhouxiangella limi TaxID=2707351 RepID=A0A845V3J5_9GAMM|nr:zinc-dependent alcohol dehydrogenase family protein [Wenzhouxiangella limi]NDY96850.1 zinc-dependent alcohol dehydrogenase family protein [Wenzhouxiangella limi]
MKAIQARYSQRGPNPEALIEPVEVDLPDPEPGEALVEVLASPINPSDLLTLTGLYGILPELPATAGNEGVGRIVALGADVQGLREGQTVLLPLGCGTWASHLVAAAGDLVPLPDNADAQQLAMLTINPPTASLLLSEFVDLKPGDWVIQNAANSGVGGYLVKLAAERGIRTINVVRREGAAEVVRSAGGDVVLIDGDDLPGQVREATDGARIQLAIDAVGGTSTERLAGCLTDGGTIVNYGVMSGQPCQVSPTHLIFRGLTLTGFWLATWYAGASTEQRTTLYADLTRRIATGQLRVPIADTFDIRQIKQAVAAAARGERAGKVLITPRH